MSEQMPSKFAPGDKVFVHQSPVRCEVIRKLSEHWLEVISENGKSAYRVPVQFAAPENSITLTLTRKESEDIIEALDAMRDFGVNYKLDKLKKQIEEKLK